MQRSMVLIALLVFSAATVKAEVLTIPASAFVPRNNSISYDTNSVRLLTEGTCCPPQMYHAPVYLPQGAVVTRVSLLAMDNVGGEFGQSVTVALLRTGPFNVFLPMAFVDTEREGAPGNVVVSDSTISAATINNTTYGYSLQLTLPRSLLTVNDLWFYAVRIRYMP